MENQVRINGIANKLGLYTALMMAVLALITFSIAICTPPVSGPFCKGSCIVYPYTDIISRFPGDYLWMYPAILLVIFYLALLACIHLYAPDNKKIFSLIGLTFSIVSSIALISDYFIQVSVIQPSLINGESDGIAILSQYNPHGVFIALEEIGYIMMSMSFVSLVPVFLRTNPLERAIRSVYLIGFALIVISFIIISVKYGIKREYRFEVASITVDYSIMIVSGILLSIFFRRKTRENLAVKWALQNMNSI